MGSMATRAATPSTCNVCKREVQGQRQQRRQGKQEQAKAQAYHARPDVITADSLDILLDYALYRQRAAARTRARARARTASRTEVTHTVWRMEAMMNMGNGSRRNNGTATRHSWHLWPKPRSSPSPGVAGLSLPYMQADVTTMKRLQLRQRSWRF